MENLTKEYRESKLNKIWIDLDNTPHVPFFSPIIKELEKAGFNVILTARDCQQTCGLADTYKLQYRCIGKHHGKNKLSKVVGLLNRSLRLLPTIIKERPVLAVSHGSRAQLLVAKMLGIKSVLIHDYEYVKALAFFKPTYLVYPEVIPAASIHTNIAAILRYPGIKEDVYVPYFIPDVKIIKELGLVDDKLIVTIRPPAVEAHYHNPKSEIIFEAVIDFLSQKDNVQMVVLPRYQSQEQVIKRKWPELCANQKIIIPDHVFNGLDLMWFSDLVISGGGTMNREAAALGVPVYSIFKGEIGAVDQYLVRQKRLILIEKVEDLKTKLDLKPWQRPDKPLKSEADTLKYIVEFIISICGERFPGPYPERSRREPGADL